MESNLIKERDKRTITRTLAKEQYDKLIQLSVDGEGKGLKARLLDEGAVINAYGDIDFYIQKGTLEKYMSALDDNYTGSINLGHTSFAEFPILLGYWSKKDLTLVDIGDGRKGLDVMLHLNRNLNIVKDLMAMPYDLAISAEFPFGVNEVATEQIGVLVINDLFITDFAIVGEGGNVGSNGITLKGETMAENKQKLEVTALTPEDVEEVVETETAEEVAETEEPVADNAEEVSVEEVTEEVEPQAEEPAEESSEVEPSPLEAVLSLVKEQNERITALEKSNADLRAELSARDTQDKEFATKFKTLTLELNNAQVQKQDVTKRKISDGIGEL